MQTENCLNFNTMEVPCRRVVSSCSHVLLLTAHCSFECQILTSSTGWCSTWAAWHEWLKRRESVGRRLSNKYWSWTLNKKGKTIVLWQFSPWFWKQRLFKPRTSPRSSQGLFFIMPFISHQICWELQQIKSCKSLLSNKTVVQQLLSLLSGVVWNWINDRKFLPQGLQCSRTSREQGVNLQIYWTLPLVIDWNSWEEKPLNWHLMVVKFVSLNDPESWSYRDHGLS